MSLDRLGVPIRSDVDRVAAACLDLADEHAREEGDPGAERRTKVNEITRRARVEIDPALTILRPFAARKRSDDHEGHEELIVRAASNGNRVSWWTIAPRTRDGKPVVALNEATIGTHPLPMGVVVGPVPDRESVAVRGWYCETHDVLLPQAYNDAAADGQVAIEEWLALPIRTEPGQHLLVPVRRAGLLETTEDGNRAAGSGGGRGE